MKKIGVICFMMMVLLGALVWAGADLEVQNLAVRSDYIEAKGSYHFFLDIKNVGNENAVTRLPASIYFASQVVPMHPGSLTRTLTNPRQEGAPINSIKVISPTGSESMVTPEFITHTYIAPAETPEEVQERKDNFLMRASRMDLTQEEVDAKVEEIQTTYGGPHDVTIEGYFITLPPGYTARYESEKSYQEMNLLNFPVGELNINPYPMTLVVDLDPKGEADTNLGNNHYTKEVTVQANVIQGPKPESEKNVALDSDKEYFAYAAGCTNIQNKNICVTLDEANTEVSVSVDGQKEVYSYYGLFMAWIYKWFGDGKLAPTETNNGVEISVYEKGFKLKFLE